jgi:hypothetical protein
LIAPRRYQQRKHRSPESARSCRALQSPERGSGAARLFWRRAGGGLKSGLLMIKREIPSPARSTRQTVKLVTCHDGELKHFIEPSLACAAQHAISICDHEEGCAQSIEADGEIVWKFDPARPRKSLEQLDELAQGECVS